MWKYQGTKTEPTVFIYSMIEDNIKMLMNDVEL